MLYFCFKEQSRFFLSSLKRLYLTCFSFFVKLFQLIKDESVDNALILTFQVFSPTCFVVSQPVSSHSCSIQCSNFTTRFANWICRRKSTLSCRPFPCFLQVATSSAFRPTLYTAVMTARSNLNGFYFDSHHQIVQEWSNTVPSTEFTKTWRSHSKRGSTVRGPAPKNSEWSVAVGPLNTKCFTRSSVTISSLPQSAVPQSDILPDGAENNDRGVQQAGSADPGHPARHNPSSHYGGGQQNLLQHLKLILHSGCLKRSEISAVQNGDRTLNVTPDLKTKYSDVAKLS